MKISPESAKPSVFRRRKVQKAFQTYQYYKGQATALSFGVNQHFVFGRRKAQKASQTHQTYQAYCQSTEIPSLSSLPFLELVPIRQKPNSLFITCSSVEHFLITSVLYFVFVMSSKLIIHKYTFESLFLLTEIWKKALLLDELEKCIHYMKNHSAKPYTNMEYYNSVVWQRV